MQVRLADSRSASAVLSLVAVMNSSTTQSGIFLLCGAILIMFPVIG